jgi:hypothetical protein
MAQKRKFLEFEVDTEGNMFCNGEQVQLTTIKGYPTFRMNKPLHRVMAEAFLPNPDNLKHVDHLDGDWKNNKLENLCWTETKGFLPRIISNNATGFAGVSFDKRRQKYRVDIDGKCHGAFPDLVSAFRHRYELERQMECGNYFPEDHERETGKLDLSTFEAIVDFLK